MTTPVILGFDVEPDGLDIPRRERPPWTGFERTLVVADRLRDRLAAELEAPVAYSWFLRMDPQIADVYGSPEWVVDTYGAELERLRSKGDEIGVHPHAWHWDDARGGWLTDTADRAWLEECVRMSFDSYAEAFGTTCRAHRFGDGFMSDSLVDMLRELGVEVDLTIEPGRGARTAPNLSEPIPDLTSAPRAPYRPDPADFRRAGGPGTGGPWMIPLAAVNPDRVLPVWRRVGRRLRHTGKPLHRPVQLWAPWPSQLLWDIIARDVEAGELPVLAFMVRADTLLDAAWAASFESHMLALPVHPLGRNVRLTTPSAFVRALPPDGRSRPSPPRNRPS